MLLYMHIADYTVTSRCSVKLNICLHFVLTLCGHILRSTHITTVGLSEVVHKKPILVDLIVFSLFLKQFMLGASTVS